MRNLGPLLSALKTFSFVDLVDVVVIACFTFWFLRVIHTIRAERLFKGIIILTLTYGVAIALNFITVSFVLRNFFAIGAIVLVVVFQPELRRILEHFGKGKLGIFGGRFFANRGVASATQLKIIELIDDACEALAKIKTGALIVIEQNDQLEDIARTGVILNAEITKELIMNIFFINTPLHDGAIIISAEKIYAAACILPLSNKPNIDKKYGTRHRAALGVSEVSDAVALVVSEERGEISFVHKGKISPVENAAELRDKLTALLLPKQGEEASLSLLGVIKKRLKSAHEWMKRKPS